MTSLPTTPHLPGIPLFTCAQLRQLDQRAIQDWGVPGFELMQRAAAAAFEALRQRWPALRRIGVACGPGNNGGDGYVLARLAREAGFEVRLIVPHGTHPRTRDAARAASEWRAAGGRVETFESSLPDTDLWVDALYGIGLSHAPSDAAQAIIERINVSRLPVLALDVPSGLDADHGVALGTAIRAQLTVSFIAGKRGLHTGDAREHTGDVHIAGLDLPAELLQSLPPAALLLRPEHLPEGLRKRHANAHKGDNGHVLCVGGEHGMGGAVRLCAEAALRTGAGLASVATRTDGVSALLMARPEAMTHAVEDVDALRPLIERADVLAVGPGLGQGEWGQSLLEACLDSGKPSVLDADALNLLAMQPRSLASSVLTPHPGEAGRLLLRTTDEIQQDRFEAIQRLCKRFDAVVVLKGAGTLVCAPGHAPFVIGAGNPGMAAGGMGDVLTGVIAALSAQGMGLLPAAAYGALLHAAAGDAAAKVDGERGLLPSDLFPALRRLSNPA